jgi:hypothetical protein
MVTQFPRIFENNFYCIAKKIADGCFGTKGKEQELDIYGRKKESSWGCYFSQSFKGKRC